MKTILFFHQSADLYGSDKALLSLVEGLDTLQFTAIVILPCEGPLVGELRRSGITVYILPLIVLGRRMFSLRGLLGLPFNIILSTMSVRRALSKVNVDLVHTNTLAVMSGAVWAKFKGLPHVWHVHEIIDHPAWASRLFSFLVRMFATGVVCNSFATQKKLLSFQPSLRAISSVIWNGIPCPAPPSRQDVDAFRLHLKLEPGHVIVALVGRINRWKGQDILVAAASELYRRGEQKILYLIVGSPPHGQEHFRARLLEQIENSPARKMIRLLDFTEDIRVVWAACDIAVVPSTEPEPFGLVALEAMRAGKPVIAANHGGLPEIVLDGENGILVEPGSSAALAHAIRVLADNSSLRESMGSRGKVIQQEQFSISSYVNGFRDLYVKLLEH